MPNDIASACTHLGQEEPIVRAFPVHIQLRPVVHWQDRIADTAVRDSGEALFVRIGFPP